MIVRKLPLGALSATALWLCACAPPASPDGERDPAVVPGAKADGSDFRTCELLAVVGWLNEGPGAGALVEAGVHARAAQHLTAHRDGPDAVFGTADDALFATIDEVDAVPWVGPTAMRQLVAAVPPCEDLAVAVPDVLHTDLRADVSALTATADVRVAAPPADRIALDAAGLDVRAVELAGRALPHARDAGWLFVDLPPGTAGELTLSFAYDFTVQEGAYGLLPNGSTLTWPYFCGNLFPCNPDPAEGMTYTLEVVDAPGTLVAAASLEREGPAYMLGWAAGELTEHPLGRTPSGTDISVWTLPSAEAEGLRGTEQLVDAFAFLEETYGDYMFGSRAGSVQADWGEGAFGGMEHHPFWHVATESMGVLETHAHEAAHGWFGNGVRIACWEDFVLSEGVTTYVAARAVEAAAGEAEADAVWAQYRLELDAALADPSIPHVAWPEGCGAVDLVEDGYWSAIPYMMGAYFMRALERRVGRGALDAALRAFYATRRGTAARFEDLLAVVEDETGYDPRPCAQAWLRSGQEPDAEVCP